MPVLDSVYFIAVRRAFAAFMFPQQVCGAASGFLTTSALMASIAVTQNAGLLAALWKKY